MVPSPRAQARHSLRHKLHLVLEAGRASGTAGMIFEAGLIGLIVANVAAVAMETVPEIHAAHRIFFENFEIFSLVVFAVEYVLRLWTAPEDPRFASHSPYIGRARYALHPIMIVDFLAFAPSFIALVVPFADLRILRLFRLVRLLKIARYSPALASLVHVIVSERRALFGTLILLLCVMCFSAAAMHFVEGELRPEVFGTIPDCMWWAITTLTTVGYGDVVPVTPLGKLIAAITMILGLGFFALPVGIIATGFVNEIHRRDFVVTWGMLARVPLFEGFDVHTIGELMNLLRAQAIGPGGIISAAGERADAMYFIVSGEVEAQLPQRKLRFTTGDFFGELALLHETMRAATIFAVTPCRLLVLSAGDFESLMQKHPGLKKRIQKMASARAEDIAQAGAISQAEIEAAHRAGEDTRDDV
jgi:voltage-gated potassium channel